MSVQRTRRYLTQLTLSLAVAISLVIASLWAMAGRLAAAPMQGGQSQGKTTVMPADPSSNGCAATFDDSATVFTGILAAQAAVDAAAPGRYHHTMPGACCQSLGEAIKGFTAAVP